MIEIKDLTIADGEITLHVQLDIISHLNKGETTPVASIELSGVVYRGNKIITIVHGDDIRVERLTSAIVFKTGETAPSYIFFDIEENEVLLLEEFVKSVHKQMIKAIHEVLHA